MRSGMVAVVGRPNVGKSSLVNALVGHKVSIVTPKPQTTRHRIQGVLHLPQGQIVFVDTPGIHSKTASALNRAMNDTATGSIPGVDVVLLVCEVGRWTDEDAAALARVKRSNAPVGLVINKIDRVKDKRELLPLIEEHGKRFEFAFMVPLSAQNGLNLGALTDEIMPRLPESPALYPADQLTGHDLKFAASEAVREKLMRQLHQEVPYALAVETEKYEVQGEVTHIHCAIWVERDGQKPIVVGEGGKVLKSVGTAARRDLEKMLGGKVFLKLWVKVRANWTNDAVILKQFGYSHEE